MTAGHRGGLRGSPSINRDLIFGLRRAGVRGQLNGPVTVVNTDG